MASAKVERPIDGFRFRYLHFYRGYTTVQRTHGWYPSEIRLVRRSSGIRSFGDAQTFRLPGDQRPRTELLDAHVYHYGHARSEEVMAQKVRYFHRFWHGDQHTLGQDAPFKGQVTDLVWFWGTHPESYSQRVSQGAQWSLDPVAVGGGRHPSNVAVLSDPRSKQSLSELTSELLQRKVNVMVYGSALALLLARMKALISRSKPFDWVIDLKAQRAFWVRSAILALFFRNQMVAAVPSGDLTRWKKACYGRVAWGGHANSFEGFRVPAQLFVYQLLQWIGFKVR